MSIKNMLKIAIIVSVIAIEYVQIGAAKEFGENEYIGDWNDVAAIRRPGNYARIICPRRKVTREADGHVSEVYSFAIGGKFWPNKGSVKIVDSTMTVTYPGRGHTLVYGIECFDDCKDLILTDKSDEMSSVLISQNNKASEAAYSKFEELAEKLGGFVHIEDRSC